MIFSSSNPPPVHDLCPPNVAWPVTGRAQDLSRWLLVEDAIFDVRSGVITILAPEAPWNLQWLHWCHDGRHLVRMQSHSTSHVRAICTEDAATGRITAGPRKFSPQQLRVSSWSTDNTKGCQQHGSFLSPKADAILVPEVTPAVSMLQLPSLQELVRFACPLADMQGSCATGWSQTGLVAIVWYGRSPSLALTVHCASGGQAIHSIVLENEPSSAPSFYVFSFTMSPQHAHAVLNFYPTSASTMTTPGSFLVDLAKGSVMEIARFLNNGLASVRCSWSPSGQHFVVRVVCEAAHVAAPGNLYTLGLTTPIWEHSSELDPV